MKLINKAYYHTWNIGFVEMSAEAIVSSKETSIEVHWIKHQYKDRFFADPFILSADDKDIKVLVEEFPYYDKKGVISLLTIDRRDFSLIERKVILKQAYHMSYPFILRDEYGNIKWISPEASMSGNLYRYSYNPDLGKLENQALLIDEPLLDSTIVKHNDLFWLFCTKRGENSNRDLYIFYSNTPEGPWTPHIKNPVISNAALARPAGYIVEIEGTLYRVIQKCDKHYGEAVNVSRITVLNKNDFQEEFVKELRAQKDDYSYCFHTINGFKDLCVVDGVKVEFHPLRRIWYEFRNLIHL